jgi:hypothetical protein
MKMYNKAYGTHKLTVQLYNSTQPFGQIKLDTIIWESGLEVPEVGINNVVEMLRIAFNDDGKNNLRISLSKNENGYIIIETEAVSDPEDDTAQEIYYTGIIVDAENGDLIDILD